MSLLDDSTDRSSMSAVIPRESPGSGNSAVPESLHPNLDNSIDEDDDGVEEHAALSGKAMSGRSASGASAVPASAIEKNGSNTTGTNNHHDSDDDGDGHAVQIHRPPILSMENRGHFHHQSLAGLSDVEVELSPTLRKTKGRSEDTDLGSSDDHGADESHGIELGNAGKRSSMVLYDGAGGHAGGGEEELEHVMPSLDRLAPLRKILNHFVWNLVIFLVISGDVVLIVFKVALAKDSAALQVITIVLMCFFLAEIGLRILAFGKEFFRNLRFVVYSLTTIAAFLFMVNAFDLAVTTRGVIAIVLQCGSAGLRFISFFFELAPAARTMISSNKSRYQANGFDLDLTYITDRLIAMGLPSTGHESLYRNPVDQVARFFNTMHKDHYLIVNLCSERTYPIEEFHGRVVRFPYDDHNPCPLSTLIQFCVYVDDFLKQDKENVVAVHCKGGKGRTGTMCASWLLYSKPDMYAEQALKMFATYRTAQDLGGRLQGVSGPSQKRYIGYFESLRFISQKGKKDDKVLEECFAHLRNTPPCELVSLTLNHVAPIDMAEKLLQKGKDGGAVSNEKARDVHNSQWNKSKNWSLLITYYPPISTFSNQAGGASAAASSSSPKNSTASGAVDEDGNSAPLPLGPKDLHHAIEIPEDPENWTCENINKRNMARYQDTKEFVFQAREKEMTESDDSVTFDISSFHSQAKSLILTGDLKFQVFRGNLQRGLEQLHADQDSDDEDGNGAKRNGGSFASGLKKDSTVGDEEKPFVYCWFWINTSFMNQSSSQLLLRKEQIDEVARDSKVDPEMNLALEYHCPPRAESWTHAPHPEFHLIPANKPLSPKTPKSPTIEEDED